MEDVYSKGKVRAIDVSNFLEDTFLDLLNHCTVVPAVNQVGTRHVSWSPLACGRKDILIIQF